MLRIVRPDGQEICIQSLTDQIYSMEDDEGWQWHWSVSEMGITPERIRGQYHGRD